jgi:hypothetical protein
VKHQDFSSTLMKLGFKPISAASTRWDAAYFSRREPKTLIVLARQGGVDLLETPRNVNDMLNEDGMLSVQMHQDGDRLAQCFYSRSAVDIHGRVIDVCERFNQGLDIPVAFFDDLGLRPVDWGGKFADRTRRESVPQEAQNAFDPQTKAHADHHIARRVAHDQCD